MAGEGWLPSVLRLPPKWEPMVDIPPPLSELVRLAPGEWSPEPSTLVISVDRPDPMRRLKVSSSRVVDAARGFFSGLPINAPSSESIDALLCGSAAVVVDNGCDVDAAVAAAAADPVWGGVVDRRPFAGVEPDAGVPELDNDP